MRRTKHLNKENTDACLKVQLHYSLIVEIKLEMQALISSNSIHDDSLFNALMSYDKRSNIEVN